MSRSTSTRCSSRSWHSTRTGTRCCDSVSPLAGGGAEHPFQTSEMGFELARILRLALPDHQSPITLGPQCPYDAKVALAVVCELLQPEGAIALRHSGFGASPMRVPEAPVNEHCPPSGALSHIWRTWKVIVPRSKP